MNLTINGPSDSASATIRIKDIVRVESCSLEFFGKKVFNLYIIVRAGTDEHFHLFTYYKQAEFKAAYLQVQSSINQMPPRAEEIRIEPLC